MPQPSSEIAEVSTSSLPAEIDWNTSPRTLAATLMIMPPEMSWLSPRTSSAIPALRNNSMVRGFWPAALGCTEVVVCFSTTSTSTPRWARNIAVDRPARPAPTTTTPDRDTS